MSRWRGQSLEQLAGTATQHLPFWVSLSLVVLIGYYLARLAWLLLPAGDERLWMPPVATPSSGQRSTEITARNYQPIVDAHLFGTASADDEPVVEQTDDAPDTRLNLKLRAAVAAEDDQMAHAIISDGTGDEKVYFVKDAVPGGATLHRVQTDRVILNRGGTLEALRLPREFAQGGPTVQRSARRRPTTSPATVQQVLTDNPAALTEVLRPQPYMPNGQLRGYRVFPGRNRQQFLKLGLRPGDLVTEINGVALNNPAQGMEVFQSLGSATQVSVTIERGGTSQVLDLDTSQLTAAQETTR